jgi:hypothetical protein
MNNQNSELMTKCQELLDAMSMDYTRWTERAQGDFSLVTPPTYHLEEGRNYIKLLHGKDDGRQSVCGFVVKKSPRGVDNKTNQPFQVGDMLMAAGYNAPSKNFARGNVFDLNPNAVRWTGV